jgi:hypothetical protein
MNSMARLQSTVAQCSLVALSEEVVRFLSKHSLRGSRTLLVHDDGLRNFLDPEAIAEALGFSADEYAVLGSDARSTFQLERGGHLDSEFAVPLDLADRLGEAKLAAVLGMASGFGLWRQLPKDSFAPVSTAVILVRADESEEVARVEGFGGFSALRLDAGLLPGVEQ